MNRLCRALGPVSLLSFSMANGPAQALSLTDPLRFFAGVTESVGTTKVIMRKSVRTRSVGHGQIEPDGSLVLVQRVEDEGRAPYARRWEIHQTGPGRFAGTMSEATGPVTIVQIGDRYRFSFKMKGDLSVEQWLTPLPGGASAGSKMTVRKFGMPVASSNAVVRKVS